MIPYTGKQLVLDEPDDVEEISNEVFDTHKTETYREALYKWNDRYFSVTYATNYDWGISDDSIQGPVEVMPVEKTVVVYVPV